jgi:hypothetical protein
MESMGEPTAATLDMYIGVMQRAVMVAAMGWDANVPESAGANAA